MKKLITTTIFALLLGFNVSAQNDGFFTYSNADNYRGGSDEWGALPILPASHGFGNDQNAAPLGNGLLLLGGMALAWLKRKVEN